MTLTRKEQPLKAISLMLIAAFMFSTMDVAIKLLVEDYASMQVVFFRCLMSAPLFAIWILATGRHKFRTAYPGGHVLRAGIGLLMLYAVGECFRELYLADAYAIFFAAPLIITLLAGVFLGERAGRARITASVIGFAGVLVVLKPTGQDLMSYGAAMGLVGVICYSFVSMMLRSLGRRDGTVTIAFWFVTLVGIGSAILMIPVWRPVDWDNWWMLAILGVSGTFGQAALTAAYRHASASVVAPFDYVHMLWAVIYGLLIWGHIPGMQTWVGSAIIIACGLYIIFRERKAQRQTAAILNRGETAPY